MPKQPPDLAPAPTIANDDAVAPTNASEDDDHDERDDDPEPPTEPTTGDVDANGLPLPTRPYPVETPR